MSTRPYASLPEQASIDPPSGGVIRSSGSPVVAPTTILVTPTGVSFGPLYLGVPKQAVASISRLTFLPSDVDSDSDWVIFGLAGCSAGAAVSTPDGSGAVSRRQALALSAALLASAAVGPRVASSQGGEDLVALKIAEFDVDATDGPIEVRVLDVVQDVLPHTTELYVDDGPSREGSIGSPSDGVVLESSVSGTVSVYLRDAEDRLGRLLSWGRGQVDRDDRIVYEGELDTPPSEHDPGEFMTLSSHPALVTPVKESGSAGSSLRIGGSEIPHESEESDGLGSYGVFDEDLVFEVGEDALDETVWNLEARLGLLEQLINRLEEAL